MNHLHQLVADDAQRLDVFAGAHFLDEQFPLVDVADDAVQHQHVGAVDHAVGQRIDLVLFAAQIGRALGVIERIAARNAHQQQQRLDGDLCLERNARFDQVRHDYSLFLNTG